MKRYIKASRNKIPSNAVAITNISDLHIGDKILWDVDEFDGHFLFSGVITSIEDDHALATVFDQYDRPIERVWVDDYVGDSSRFWLLK